MSSLVFRKQFFKKSKRYITLVEMMVVIFIIGLIVSVVGFRYQGGLEKGKAFKTETSIDKVETILTLHIAENPSLTDNIANNWEDIIKRDPLVKDADALIKDGWGQKLQVGYDQTRGIHVWSTNLDNYKQKQK